MMHPKLSALKEELLNGCGFTNNNDLLFTKEKQLNLKYLNYILGKELISRTSYLIRSGNSMATRGVGSHLIEECLNVIASAIEKISNYYNFQISEFEEKIDINIILYDMATVLLKNHQDPDLPLATKKFSIDAGLDLCLYTGSINSKEAAELKEKLYAISEISFEEEAPTPDYNLDYLYKRVFG